MYSVLFFTKVLGKTSKSSSEESHQSRKSSLTITSKSQMTILDPLSEFALEMDPLSKTSIEMVS